MSRISADAMPVCIALTIVTTLFVSHADAAAKKKAAKPKTETLTLKVTSGG